MEVYPNNTVDHAVLQLCMSIFCICCCVFICRDRGIKSDQYALRLLGNSELCYQIVRLFSSLIIMLLSGCSLGIAAKFSKCVPFDKLGIPSSMIAGICLTLPLCPMTLLIGTIFGSNGAINPIIVMLIVSLCSNFITEIAFYICLGAKNYKDYTIVPKGLYYFLVMLPNVNAINILDLAKINTQNSDNTKATLHQTFRQSDQILCNKQSSIMSLKYYQIDKFNLLILYNLISSLIYFLLSLIFAYWKSEPYYPGVNPFKLLFFKQQNNQQQLELKNVDIIYKSWKKRIIAVNDLNISFNQIHLSQNIDKINLGLLGCSGSGKSSTMGVLTGQIKPHGDICTLLGYNLKDKTQLYAVKQKISYCPQLNENVVQSLTMKQNIRFSQYLGNNINYFPEYIEQELRSLDLPKNDLQVKNLSGGMLRRLSLLNSLIQQRQFYVFDEITSGIDSFNAELIDQKIQQLNCPFILSTHDMYEVEKLCNYVIIMKYGKTMLSGSVNQIKFNNQLTTISLRYDINDQNRQTIYNIFNNENFQLLINSPTIIKYQIKNNENLPLLTEQLQQHNITKYIINRSNLNDIFVKYAGIENQEEENQNQQEIQKPELSSKHRILGTLNLFYANDIRNRILYIPPTILFLVVIILGQIAAYLIYIFCKDYTDYLYDTYIQAYKLNQGRECLQCCNVDLNTQLESINDLQQIIQQCDPQCYSSYYDSPYLRGSCLTFAMTEGFPDLQPPEKIYYGHNIYDSNNVGFYNSQEKRLFIDFNQKLLIKKQSFPNYQKLDCYTCQSVCDMRCFNQECQQQCQDILQNQIHIENINCSGKCYQINNTTYTYNEYTNDKIIGSQSFAYQAQKNRRQLKSKILNGKNKDLIINEEVQDWIPVSIIKNISYNQQIYNLASYFPSIRGGISIYGDFKVEAEHRDYNETILQQNQNPYDAKFWNYDNALITSYNKTVCTRDCIYPCEFTTELADANGVSLLNFPFDMYSYEITTLFNKIIQSQQKKKGYGLNYEIQYTSKPQPYFPYQHESTTFTTYLAIVQCLIISILFEIPMIQSSITFTELKTTKIFNLLKLHGVQKIHIITGYLLFQIIIIIGGSIITLIISYLLHNEQANTHPILFCLYLIEISFSSLIFGIIISLISNDKRKSALIASVFILLSMFLTIFLTHNSFLICFIPQLFSMWRLQYLSHTTQYEWMNLFVPLLETIILSILLFQLYDIQQIETIDNIGQDSVFDYQNHYLQGRYKQIQLNNDTDNNCDLNVQNVSLNIGQKEILHNINFKVDKQQIFALLGLSGSGKSVTLKTLTKQLHNNQGEILLNQNDVMKNINNLKTNIISYVPQNDILPLNFKLYDIYNIFKYIHGHKNKQFIYQAEQALNLQQHRDKYCYQLSGGQKRRLSLLIALLQSETNIIAFDEVTTGQSPDLKQIILNLISQTNQNFKKTCIITTHYLDEVINIAENFILLSNGEIQFKNTINSLLKEQSIKIQIGSQYISNIHSEIEQKIYAEGNIITFDQYNWNQVLQYLSQHKIDSWITVDDNPSNIFLSIYKGIQISKQ